MKLARRMAPVVASMFTSPRTRDLRRAIAERSRRLRGAPHLIRYFHQVDDPYSHLAAQVLAELVARYDVEVEPHLVGPPSDAAAPQRESLAAYARKDAADVAPYYGLSFPRHQTPPAPEKVQQASAVLATAIASERFIETATKVGQALWEPVGATTGDTSGPPSPADAEALRAAVDSGNGLRERLGHYLGAMFHYGGEWYWGVDRLWHLEREKLSRVVDRFA